MHPIFDPCLHSYTTPTCLRLNSGCLFFGYMCLLKTLNNNIFWKSKCFVCSRPRFFNAPRQWLPWNGPYVLILIFHQFLNNSVVGYVSFVCFSPCPDSPMHPASKQASVHASVAQCPGMARALAPILLLVIFNMLFHFNLFRWHYH